LIGHDYPSLAAGTLLKLTTVMLERYPSNLVILLDELGQLDREVTAKGAEMRIVNPEL
jgi:hypothetical protein